MGRAEKGCRRREIKPYGARLSSGLFGGTVAGLLVEGHGHRG
jgi:hypothetical protein